MAVSYHGKVVGPKGQIYLCEHNHRTETAAVTCASSSATRRMAALAWNRAAAQAAQAAALARRREQERAAAHARKIAAQQASAARLAAVKVAAEDAKAAKRARKLAAMSPRRAWRRMTTEERLLKIADAELDFYGKILSPEAQAAYEARSATRRAGSGPGTPQSALTSTPAPPVPPTLDRPAHLRAHDPHPPRGEQTVAEDRAAQYPVQWPKYLAALQAPHQSQAAQEMEELKATPSAADGVQARDAPPAGPTAPRTPPSSAPVSRNDTVGTTYKPRHAETTPSADGHGSPAALPGRREGVSPVTAAGDRSVVSERQKREESEAQQATARPRAAVSHTVRRASSGPGVRETGARLAPGRIDATGAAGNGPEAAGSHAGLAGAEPGVGTCKGFGGDGLFVVGLDITPGVYRTAGPGSGRRRGYFFLLRSTSTRDIAESSGISGPATITVGPGVKAVKVSGCQPWYRLGDTLDAVIAAAAKRETTASSD